MLPDIVIDGLDLMKYLQNPPQELCPKEAFLATAARRVVEVPRFLKTKGAYWEADPQKAAVARGIAEAYAGKTRLFGRDHLFNAFDQRTKRRLKIVSMHGTDGDSSATRKVLEDHGLKAIADQNFFMAGLKMYERPLAKVLFPIESVVMVPTPFDLQAIDHALKEGRSTYTDRELELIGNYSKTMNTLSRSALRETIRLQKEGKVLNVYPEATRTRTGFLGKVPAEIDMYFREKDADDLILPAASVGMEKLIPVGKTISRDKYAKYLKNVPLTQYYGRPLSVGQIEEWRKRAEQQGIPATRADLSIVMIGELVPDRIAPDRRQWHHDLVSLKPSA